MSDTNNRNASLTARENNKSMTPATEIIWEVTSTGWETNGASIIFVPTDPRDVYVWMVRKENKLTDCGACPTLDEAKALAEEALRREG